MSLSRLIRISAKNNHVLLGTFTCKYRGYFADWYAILSSFVNYIWCNQNGSDMRNSSWGKVEALESLK